MPIPPRPRPSHVTLDGRYCRLEPLSEVHVEALFAASSGAGTEERFAFLFDDPPTSVEAMRTWIAEREEQNDPLFFAVVDRATQRAGGRQALMRVTPEHGVIEVGSILFGAAIARTRVATEALYLLTRYVFEDLGYRRFEWKCHAANESSKRAALRFGFVFEGVFRQHMWLKGANRDTAWFALLDRDWPRVREAFDAWLDPTNFDESGQQRKALRVHS